MTPSVLRLHEERKARLVRMNGWQGNAPVVRLPKRDIPIPPPKVAEPAIEKPKPKTETPVRLIPECERFELPHEIPDCRLDSIVYWVCKYYFVTREEALSYRRGNFKVPRFTIFYLATRYTGLSLSEIGRQLGKDHTTIMYGARKIAPIADRTPAIHELCCILRNWSDPNENTSDQCEGGETRGSEHDGL